MRRWWLIRDILLFCGGFGGVVNESLFTTSDRPDLLVLYAGMMGLPAFLQTDGRRSRGGSNEREDGK